MGEEGVDGRVDGWVQQSRWDFDVLGLLCLGLGGFVQGRAAEGRLQRATAAAAKPSKIKKKQICLRPQRICLERIQLNMIRILL